MDQFWEDTYLRVNPNKLFVSVYETPSQLPELSHMHFRNNEKPIILVDDSMLENNKRTSEIAVFGRPLKLPLIVISQAISRVQKSTIRENSNVYTFSTNIKKY